MKLESNIEMKVTQNLLLDTISSQTRGIYLW